MSENNRRQEIIDRLSKEGYLHDEVRNEAIEELKEEAKESKTALANFINNLNNKDISFLRANL